MAGAPGGRATVPGALWRLLRALAHGVHGLLIVLLRFPTLDRAGRCARIAWWSGRMITLLGLRLEVEGAGFKPGAKLIVANHVSWVDILALHAVCPEARFVSKADVQRWPLVHRLVAAAETLYIERERRRDALRVVHRMAEALAAGETVAIFPEGTTSDGTAVLPFHANLLQAAVATGVPVQPVALRYADAQGQVAAAAAYVGETSLAQSMWLLSSARGIVVQVAVRPPRGTAHADRRRLAQSLHSEIADTLAALSRR